MKPLKATRILGLAALTVDQIGTTATTDPRKAFKEFEHAVPRIDDAAKKRGEEIKARGQACFAQWEYD